MSDRSPEPLDVDSPELFYEHPSRVVHDLDLRAERRRPGTRRCRRHDDDRAREECIGLKHDRETLAALLVPGTSALA